MAALTSAAVRKSVSDPQMDAGGMLDNKIIYVGGIVMLDTSNRAQPGAVATNCSGVGCAVAAAYDIDRYDNTVSGHADNFVTAYWQEGVFGLKNDGSNPVLSSTQPGTPLYILDDQTVSLSSNGNTRSVAGLLNRLDSVDSLVYVEMSKRAAIIARSLVAVAGYSDGAVTQITSVATGVTLNAAAGVITTFSQSAAAGAVSTFTVTNNYCSSTSVPLVSILNYAGTYGTNGFPMVTASTVGSGSFAITVVNTAPTNALSGVLKIGFSIQ